MGQFRVLLILCVVVSTYHSQGQTVFGIKGGMGLCNIKVDGEIESMALRFQVGVVSQISLSKKFYLGPELLYAEKGFTARDPFRHVTISTHINYLNVPILLGLKFTEGFIFAGPELGFKVGEHWKNSLLKSDVFVFRTFDMGVVFGGNFMVSSNFGIDLRYILGLKDLMSIDVMDENLNKIGEEITGSNRVFQLGLLYVFVKKKS